MLDLQSAGVPRLALFRRCLFATVFAILMMSAGTRATIFTNRTSKGYPCAMKLLGSLRNAPVSAVLVVCALVGILLVLAVLQYQWIGQFSSAERERMQERLRVTVSQFQQQFNEPLFRMAASFQMEPPSVRERDWNRFIDLYKDWTEHETHAGLLADLYVWDVKLEEEHSLLKLDHRVEKLRVAPWPDEFASIKKRFNMPFRRRRPRGGPEMRPPFIGWVVHPEIPALTEPLFSASPSSGRPFGSPDRIAQVIIRLDWSYIREEFLPYLTSRNFGDLNESEYQIAVLKSRDPETPVQILYQSSPKISVDAEASFDSSVGLFWDPRTYRDGGPGDTTRRPPNASGPFPDGRSLRRRMRSTPILLSDQNTDNWKLVVKHRQGSLEAAVAGLRRRNLAISFGVLLILAISMVMIIVSTQRAKRLAKLQMDFMAGVSHELRTPLAVIRSAGDNLADGTVVSSSERVKQYGEIIRNEGRRLSAMLENILQLAAGRSVNARYDLKPSSLAKILDTVLAEAAPIIESDQFEVDKRLESDLPAVLTDERALAQCLKNLLSNALKYGGQARWIGIRAFAAENATKKQVCVTFEDKGMGIHSEDIPHIFDPFYRAEAAKSGQIQGSGLGLSLVHEAITSMGGSIEVQSSEGRGSIFTIRLPTAKEAND